MRIPFLGSDWTEILLPLLMVLLLAAILVVLILLLFKKC